MKKRSTFIFLIMIMVLCTSKIVFAEDKVSSTAIVTPTPPVKPIDITTDPLYTTLLSKNDSKNKLILIENQVCKEIKEQEESNRQKVSAIIEKSQSYRSEYNKIIDDIKSVLEPIKEKEILYNINELTKNKTDTKTNADTSSTEEIIDKEAGIYYNQISNLNLAIKAMRESMKYISLESVAYHEKLEAVQKNIDKINLSIDELNKEIIAHKISKENEWNDFCSAMVKNDLKTANEKFDKLLTIKIHIIMNYDEILRYKRDINSQLTSLENMQDTQIVGHR